MQRFNPTHIFWMATIIALSLIAVWSGRDLELGPDGLKLQHPQSQTAETLRPPQERDTRP